MPKPSPHRAALFTSIIAASLAFGCGTPDPDAGTSTPGSTPTLTSADTPTATNTPVLTPTPEATPTPEVTDTPEATDTPEVTGTPTQTATPAAPGTIPEVAEGAGTFTTLLAAVDAAGLGDTLSAEGPYTLFAPDDAAFAKLDPALLASLINNPSVLRDILLYHVVDGAVPEEVAITLSSALTLQGSSFSLALEGEGDDQVLKVGPATVTQTDIMASNGIIHVIDTLLLPPGLDVIPTVARARGYNLLAVALSAAGLEQTLSEPGPYTLFAPTDAAFNSLGTPLFSSLAANPLTLRQILLYHTLNGATPSAELTTLSEATTLQGGAFTIDTTAGLKVDGANVTATDILALNGMVYELDTVIVPSEIALIPQVADDLGRFSTLLSALTSAELEETLSGPGPFTILAPNDAAFDQLPEGELEALMADKDALAELLRYHVLGRAVPAEDLQTLSTSTTLQGASITVSVNGDTIMINDGAVLTSDVPALNGIIHEIDTVLTIPASEQGE